MVEHWLGVGLTGVLKYMQCATRLILRWNLCKFLAGYSNSSTEDNESSPRTC